MPTDKDDKTPEYAVGNKRPPKHQRFQPGKSGNPSGRPKGSRGTKASLKRELNKKVTVKKNGKPTKMTKEEVIIAQLVDNSMRGDLKSSALVLRMSADNDNSIDAASLADDIVMPDKESLKRIAGRLVRLVTDED